MISTLNTLWRKLLTAVVLISGTAVWAADVQQGAVPPGPAASGQNLHWHVEVVPVRGKPGDEVEIVFTADIGQGWILYSSDFNVEIGPRPAKFTFDANPSLTLLGPIRAVKAQRKKDHTFHTEYSYFSSHAEFRQKARLTAPLDKVTGRIDGQTCYEESGLCELFRENFSANL
jgi:cytochrome c biogenesis DsbD-like protein